MRTTAQANKAVIVHGKQLTWKRKVRQVAQHTLVERLDVVRGQKYEGVRQ